MVLYSFFFTSLMRLVASYKVEYSLLMWRAKNQFPPR